MTQAPASSDVYRDHSGVIVAALSVVVGIIVLIYASGMPEIRPGIPGPGLFPTMIGGFMVLFGIPLGLLSWFRARPPVDEDIDPAPDDSEDGVETVGKTEGALATSSRSAVINALAFIAAITFYIVAAELLGFFPTMIIITVALMLLLKVKPVTAIIVGVATTIVLWALFEKLLLVQLPNGFLGF